MSEEVPFKSIKITLSEEALDRLADIVRTGSFRSNSMAVEECIRAIYDISRDLGVVFSATPKDKAPSIESCQEAFRRYTFRLARFVAGRIRWKSSSSAGP